LTKFCGTNLFGLEHPTTQKLLQQLQVPTCKPHQWNDKNVMISLYEYHLKRRTIIMVEWLQLFTLWLTKGNNIIELMTSFKKIYPQKYVFSERELQAWNSMLRAAGCSDVTPFDNDISPVGCNL